MSVSTPIQVDRNAYYKKRMLQIGADTEEKRLIWVKDNYAEHPAPSRYQQPVFFPDREGNIEILYTTLERELIWIEKSKTTSKRKRLTITRLREPQGDRKYLFPKGLGVQTFYPKLIQDAYDEGREVPTLIITEGAFKAWKGCDAGAHVIGLGSITHYQQDGRIIQGIERFIKKCKVVNLVILWDGDCLDISAKHIGTSESLTKRPAGFYNAAKAIKRLAEAIEFEEEGRKLNIYFKHIKPQSFKELPKGLDDILIVAEKQNSTDAVIRELQQTKAKKETQFYFKSFNITAQTSKLFKYFAINTVEAFYNRHEDLIQLNSFVFRNDVYQYDEAEDKLILKAPEWAKEVVWIGDEYFKILDVPGPHGFQRKMLPRAKSTLSDIYGKDFQQYVEYYEGFCNVPSHFDFQPKVGKFYNRYAPFRWTAEEGKCQTIINFFKHIFGEKVIKHRGNQYKSWELGLDYVQLLLSQPTQILPVICLFSAENSTGKSTFGKLLKLIFSDNVITIGNHDIKSQFNDTYSDKLVAICEETLLERKKDAEIIKAMATASTITVNPKGQKQFEIGFFCKFMFFSNNRRMIYVTGHDERFWILEVKKPKADNPTIMEDMKKEIPAFIQYLKEREITAPRESRMWFHPNMIKTDTLKEAIAVNQPGDAAHLREWLKDMFIDFNLQEIQMPLKHLISEAFNGSKARNWIKELLKEYFETDLLRDGDGNSRQVRGRYPYWKKHYGENGEEEEIKGWKKFNGRPYVFKREDYVDEAITFDEQEGTEDDVPF